jgi:hypothetical protein
MHSAAAAAAASNADHHQELFMVLVWIYPYPIFVAVRSYTLSLPHKLKMNRECKYLNP